MLRSLLTRILDIFFPPACHLCDDALEEGRSLCESCKDGLERVKEPFCDHCGEPFDGQISGAFLCPNCGGNPLAFDFAIAPLRFSIDARETVHGLKYRKKRYLSPEMSSLMAETFRQDERFEGEEWTLTPVPLHWVRKMKRNFNQAEDLTLHLSRILGLKREFYLKRKKATVSQVHLNRAKRLKNLSGKFVSSRRLEGEDPLNIILVDDVLTTGSTAHECAKTLRTHPRVKKVAVLTFMRG